MERESGFMDMFKKKWRKDAEVLAGGFGLSWARQYFGRLLDRATEYGSDQGDDSDAARCAYLNAGVLSFQEELQRLSMVELRRCKMRASSRKFVASELLEVARLVSGK